MKWWPTLLLVALAFAGCTGDEPSNGVESPQSVSSGGNSLVMLQVDPITQPIAGTMDEGGFTRHEWTFTGMVDQHSMVAIWSCLECTRSGSYAFTEANGSFSLPDYFVGSLGGIAEMFVVAWALDENGNEIEETKVSQAVALNLLAPATVTIDYGPNSDKGNLEDTVWVNTVDYDAQARYDTQSTKHPEYVNIHDVLVAWENQHGYVIDYSYNEGFGSFGVERIDGEGNALSEGEPPWWCYQTNDDGYADQGITPMRFTPGDIIAWDLGSCNGVMGGT